MHFQQNKQQRKEKDFKLELIYIVLFIYAQQFNKNTSIQNKRLYISCYTFKRHLSTYDYSNQSKLSFADPLKKTIKWKMLPTVHSQSPTPKSTEKILSFDSNSKYDQIIRQHVFQKSWVLQNQGVFW